MKIYMPEPVPSGNKGEEAILLGIYQGLKDQGKEIKISVFSKTLNVDRLNYYGQFKVIEGITFAPSPDKATFLKIIETASIWTKHLAFLVLWRLIGKKCLYFFRGGNWKAYADADIILVGHDSCFSDLNIPFAFFVKVMGKKAVIFGCGISARFRFKLIESIAHYILSKMELMTVREKWSYDYLRSLGVPADKVHFKPDPAFLLKPAKQADIENFFKNEKLLGKKKPLIGMVIVKGTNCFNKFYEYLTDETERYQKHIEFSAQIVETVLEITSGTVIFLPHCIQSSYERDDRICARDIKAKIKKFYNDVILIENEYNAEVLKGVIQRLDFLVSERLHAVIGSASVGTPFIMLAAKEDIRSIDIVTYTIGSEDLLFYLNKANLEEFSKKFEHAWTSRETIKQNLLEKAETINHDCQEAARLLAYI